MIKTLIIIPPISIIHLAYQIIVTNEAYYNVLVEMAMLSRDLNPTDDLKNVWIRTKTKELGPTCISRWC